jgi:hypothetical protein
VKLKVGTSKDKCHIYKSTTKHNHKTVVVHKNKPKLVQEVKTLIEEYEAADLKPKAIMSKLRDAGFEAPVVAQINRYLAIIRGEKVESDTLYWSLQDLVDFATKRQSMFLRNFSKLVIFN